MEVAKHMQGAVTVIALDGELDSSTAPRVHEQLGDLVPPRGLVLIDLGRTSYMSSAGLRVLLLVYRQAQANGARLALACAPPDVREVMAATGFLGFFTVTDTLAEGLAALEP
ncbi:STAS domain-containing protein [Amycolatopsis sp. NPDC004772]|jgi:anti-sigma B factor antagonist